MRHAAPERAVADVDRGEDREGDEREHRDDDEDISHGEVMTSSIQLCSNCLPRRCEIESRSDVCIAEAGA